MKTIYHLEMTDPFQLTTPSRYKKFEGPDEIVLNDKADWQFNKHMYMTIGKDCGWVSRRRYSDDTWKAICNNDSMRTYRFYFDKVLVGYGELVYWPDKRTYISRFGILPEFQNKGYGSLFLYLLTQEAWRNGTTLVTVDTTSNDGMAALPNYFARGFRLFRVEKK